MFFDSWADLGRVVLVAVLAYVGLIVLLRVSGKRTLSKMNAFDFVVTIALGSTLASTILSESTTLVEGLGALAALVGLQWIATWLSVRSERFQQLIKDRPALVFFDGRFLEDAMARERVTTEEVRSAARAHGYADLGAVAAIVLETEGTFTVLGDHAGGADTALADVEGAAERTSVGEPHPPVAR